MPVATPILDCAKEEEAAKHQRLNFIKFTVAVLGVFALLALGNQGSRAVLLQARVDEARAACGQLQQMLDDELRPSDQAIDPTLRLVTDANQKPLTNQPLEVLAGKLRAQLRSFDSVDLAGKLSAIQALELQMSQATLANAEHRFAVALAMVADPHAMEQSAGSGFGQRCLVQRLQIRADAFYGLHDWRNALNRYTQILYVQTDHRVALARVADCQRELGNLAEAFTASVKVARLHNNRGGTLLEQGKFNAAVAEYRKAIEVQTDWIQQGRNELSEELSKSYDNLGNALLVQGNPDAASKHYETAIEIQTRLLRREWRHELEIELATSHEHLGDSLLVLRKPGTALAHFQKAIEIQAQQFGTEGHVQLAINHDNLGNSFLSQRGLDAAIGEYEMAIDLLTHLGQTERPDEWESELAMSYNDRGVARRALGKIESAAGDFESAIQILNRRLEQSAGNEPRAEVDEGEVHRPQVTLEVATGYAEKAIEIVPRTRLRGRGGQRVKAVALAMSLKNRGYVRSVEGKPGPAIADFSQAAAIYARLVNQEGQKNLNLEFAKSLLPLASIYSTHPDLAFRNGSKAKALAKEACELSEWKASGPFAALAAACAETGDFAEAVKWQEKAVEFAPTEHKAEVGSRVILYQSRTPLRTPFPKVE